MSAALRHTGKTARCLDGWQVKPSRIEGGINVNWIIFNDQRYRISPLPLDSAFRLTVPGERNSILLDRRQMKRMVKESLGLSGKSQVKARR